MANGVLLSAALLASATTAQDLQIGLLGAFVADRLVLSKASNFDDLRGSQWVVSETMQMSNTEPWLTYFVQNPADTELTIEADGRQTTIPLPADVWSDASHRSKDSVRVQRVKVGDRQIAVVQVPDHFSDVWVTFYERAKIVLVHQDPEHWEALLGDAWKAAWAYWDTGRVYTLMFGHSLGEIGVPQSLEIVFQEVGVEKSRRREFNEDSVWFATSVPHSGKGSSLFRVRVDSRETEEKKLDVLPSQHSARCVDLNSDNSDDGLQVFVAAFSTKSAYDMFRRSVEARIDRLWDTTTRQWLFDDLAQMCSKLDLQRDASAMGGKVREILTPNAVQQSESKATSHAEEESETSTLILIIGSTGAAAIVLLLVVFWLCRGGGMEIKSDSSISTMGAPDIHGDAWDIDGTDVSVFARDRPRKTKT